jgi:hypothetical protein
MHCRTYNDRLDKTNAPAFIVGPIAIRSERDRIELRNRRILVNFGHYGLGRGNLDDGKLTKPS